MSYWYCPSCFPNAVDYGEIYPGHHLIRWGKNDFEYSIVEEHNEHFRFPAAPYVADTYKFIDVENDLTLDYDDQMTRNLQMNPHHGYTLIELCKQEGFEPETDYIGNWLINRALQLIKEKENLEIDKCGDSGRLEQNEK